jgi:hypothetical protein
MAELKLKRTPQFPCDLRLLRVWSRLLALQSLMLYFSAQAAEFNVIRNFRGEVLEWPNRAAC